MELLHQYSSPIKGTFLDPELPDPPGPFFVAYPTFVPSARRLKASPSSTPNKWAAMSSSPPPQKIDGTMHDTLPLQATPSRLAAQDWQAEVLRKSPALRSAYSILSHRAQVRDNTPIRPEISISFASKDDGVSRRLDMNDNDTIPIASHISLEAKSASDPSLLQTSDPVRPLSGQQERSDSSLVLGRRDMPSTFFSGTAPSSAVETSASQAALPAYTSMAVDSSNKGVLSTSSTVSRELGASSAEPKPADVFSTGSSPETKRSISSGTSPNDSVPQSVVSSSSELHTSRDAHPAGRTPKSKRTEKPKPSVSVPQTPTRIPSASTMLTSPAVRRVGGGYSAGSAPRVKPAATPTALHLPSEKRGHGATHHTKEENPDASARTTPPEKTTHLKKPITPLLMSPDRSLSASPTPSNGDLGKAFFEGSLTLTLPTCSLSPSQLSPGMRTTPSSPNPRRLSVSEDGSHSGPVSPSKARTSSSERMNHVLLGVFDKSERFPPDKDPDTPPVGSYDPPFPIPRRRSNAKTDDPGEEGVSETAM
eukprot:CAMPEP_0184653262 /NCGR_PEP_ID=MMETSP0308-20130426/10991_1 /TAXON_ID=38269 /ORGANISM="Gloeochaete witrockiana, Strain SAG 46.84" /LENGTH=535 /DNA_ID=CAMNT_0027088629 /DNA_START=134 /DNA_END=1741 /DNA_ORIENTATION=+